jgi:hypothetical protein
MFAFCTSISWTGVLSMYWRNSAPADSAAPVVQEKPSPPDSTADGLPAPPGTCGNGNQPSSEMILALVVRAGTTLVSQSPCSSMPALPLASRPAELPAPVWAWVALKPPWNGLVAMNALRSWVALEKHGALMLMALIADCRSDWEHSRTAKYSQ